MSVVSIMFAGTLESLAKFREFVPIELDDGLVVRGCKTVGDGAGRQPHSFLLRSSHIVVLHPFGFQIANSALRRRPADLPLIATRLVGSLAHDFLFCRAELVPK